MVLGYCGPAVNRHHALFGIQPHNNMAGKGFAGFAHKLRVFHRGGADNHIGEPQIEVFFDGGQIADAAAQLHGQGFAHFLQNGADGFEVFRFAGECAVQVHQMQAARALFHPMQRHFGRLVGKHGGLIHQALLQAHAAAFF